MLHNRSAEMLSRSGAGGVIDFSDGQHGNTSGGPPGFSSRSRFSPGRRQRASTYAGRSSFSSMTGGNSIGRTRVTGMKRDRVGSAPVNSNLPRGLSFVPRSVSSDARLTPALAPVSESDIEEAPLGFGLNRTAYSEPGVTPAYAGRAVVTDGQRQSERNAQTGALDKKSVPEREETTAAGRIGELLSALPLSKLKIVIGKQQDWTFLRSNLRWRAYWLTVCRYEVQSSRGRLQSRTGHVGFGFNRDDVGSYRYEI